MQEVGRNLRLVREALGWTQQQMAEKFDLGDKSKVSNWERGLNYPDPYFVLHLWTKHRISADFIYLGERGSLPHSVAVSLPAAEEA
jgi:DNA-binding XRE family transcriptional regulator